MYTYFTSCIIRMMDCESKQILFSRDLRYMEHECGMAPHYKSFLERFMHEFSSLKKVLQSEHFRD